LMPVLQPKENWQKTGRWESVDDLYRFTSYYSKTDLVLGPTHEEVVVPLAKKFIFSYKDLPKYIFQIQNKFRDEKRAKGGLLRGREFMMKDLYSFHVDEKDLNDYYEKVGLAYTKIFDRVGIGEKTFKTFATGGSFSQYSHEYQTESESGEDQIFLCEKCRVAVNREIIKEQNTCPECKNAELKEIKAIEVGNIFKLNNKFSDPFKLNYKDNEGNDKPVIMGCYGIGLGRLMGAVVEVSHDDSGIIWPKSLAPYQIHLISLGSEPEIISQTNKIYDLLSTSGYEVIWDDRDETAGVKLFDADLLGMPIRVVVSKKMVQRKSVEIKVRKNSFIEVVAENRLLQSLKKGLDVQ